MLYIPVYANLPFSRMKSTSSSNSSHIDENCRILKFENNNYTKELKTKKMNSIKLTDHNVCWYIPIGNSKAEQNKTTTLVYSPS